MLIIHTHTAPLAPQFHNHSMHTAMPELCDLRIHVNGQQTFFLNQRIMSKYSARLKKFIIRRGKRRTPVENSDIKIKGFPGGPDGFELVSRFCYNSGGIEVNLSNVCLLHCCALFLEMRSLLHETESFLETVADWSLSDALICLRNCESVFPYADSSGLVPKLVSSLVTKLSPLYPSSSSSSSSSSSLEASSSPESVTRSFGKSNPWWFDDLTILPPSMIEQIFKAMGSRASDCNSLLLTRFLLHYLQKSSAKLTGGARCSPEYGALADTAVYGVNLIGRSGFSCRSLFSVLRVVSAYDLSGDCRAGLEKMIGEMLDQATFDDLLVRDHGDSGVYDVNLVRRLIRVFVSGVGSGEMRKMKKVGRLVDQYMGEIAPDQRLEVTKFLGVAESVPDWGRDCFDGVYRAIDIFLQAHPRLPFEERSRLCRCLNYEKLTLEACKDLAKNHRIPPRIAIQALMSQSQQTPNPPAEKSFPIKESPRRIKSDTTISFDDIDNDAESFSSEEREGMRLKLQRMQCRVVELERACRDMKGQMSRLVRSNNTMSNNSSPSYHHRTLPRLC